VSGDLRPAVLERPRNHAALVRAALREAPRLPEPVTCETCGKHRYATAEAAEKIIRLRQGQRGEQAEARAYLDHGWWHLTSQDDSRRY
jgi:hypothetical protein